ncbi:hypothetical protein MTR67_027484 [Solanum verrucosum]|uniref:Uncharacterized protein n=1 Tax=Solanum verrucosum TaxID=315347 RepID=A0AAF0R9P8_SOLVR|nr:hypothetical protein MTR67_027484 [Solanum verrucosum]
MSSPPPPPPPPPPPLLPSSSSSFFFLLLLLLLLPLLLPSSSSSSSSFSSFFFFFFFFSFSFFFSPLLHDLSRYVVRTFSFSSSSVLCSTTSAVWCVVGIVWAVMLLELDFDEIDANICTVYKFWEFSFPWRNSVLHVTLLPSSLVVRVFLVCDTYSLMLFTAFHFSHYFIDALYTVSLSILLGFDVLELRVFRKQPLYLNEVVASTLVDTIKLMIKKKKKKKKKKKEKGKEKKKKEEKEKKQKEEEEKNVFEFSFFFFILFFFEFWQGFDLWHCGVWLDLVKVVSFCVFGYTKVCSLYLFLLGGCDVFFLYIVGCWFLAIVEPFKESRGSISIGGSPRLMYFEGFDLEQCGVWSVFSGLLCC